MVTKKIYQIPKKVSLNMNVSKIVVVDDVVVVGDCVAARMIDLIAFDFPE